MELQKGSRYVCANIFFSLEVCIAMHQGRWVSWYPSVADRCLFSKDQCPCATTYYLYIEWDSVSMCQFPHPFVLNCPCMEWLTHWHDFRDVYSDHWYMCELAHASTPPPTARARVRNSRTFRMGWSHGQTGSSRIASSMIDTFRPHLKHSETTVPRHSMRLP